jgi:hypothetical protein
MAQLPEPLNATVNLIYEAYEADAKSGHRPHLGASLIGRECARSIWYSFHWVTQEKMPGRVLRLLARGEIEEPRWWADLRRIGVTVHDRSPGGLQWRVSAHGGHFGGSLDAVVIGLPEAPKAYHVAECKTHNAASFKKLTASGVLESKPEHFAQMQVYMHLNGIDRAIYLATNKDTDALYTERVEYDATAAEQLMARAQSIIQATEPPLRISNDASWFSCKFCPHHAVCHGTDLPEVNCRTCAHSTPCVTKSDETPDEEGGHWSCEVAIQAGWSEPVTLDIQRTGCPSHRYIPIFLEKTGVVHGMRENGDVEYRDSVGLPFVNGEGPGALTSHELRALEDKDGAWLACSKKLELQNLGMEPEVVG